MSYLSREEGSKGNWWAKKEEQTRFSSIGRWSMLDIRITGAFFFVANVGPQKKMRLVPESRDAAIVR